MVAVKKNRKQRRMEQKLKRKEAKRQRKESALHIQTLFQKAITMHQNESPEEIAKFYQKKLEDPETPLEELELYGMSAVEFESFDTGIALLKKAHKLSPGSLEVLFYLGSTYYHLRLYDQALEYLKKAFILGRNHIPTISLLALVQLEREDFASTIEYCHHGLEFFPNGPELLTTLGEAFLRSKQYERAMLALKKSYLLDPINTRTLSLLYISLTQAKDSLNINEIYPFKKLIQAYSPTEFPATKQANPESQFFDSLSELIRNHPSLENNPVGLSTRNGSQTLGDLLQSSDHPFFQFVERHIHLAVENYIKNVDLPEKHPTLLKTPREYRIASWAVVLKEGGHQAPHVHLDGWLSGVYYLRLPDEFDHLPDHQGELCFGEWSDKFECFDYGEASYHPPKIGNIIMFPSFLWHKTIPFHSHGERICISFDIIPT